MFPEVRGEGEQEQERRVGMRGNEESMGGVRGEG